VSTYGNVEAEVATVDHVVPLTERCTFHDIVVGKLVTLTEPTMIFAVLVDTYEAVGVGVVGVI
jgi:hypothetical protein